MDNYPEPNVLPRAEDDEKTAKALSKILPTVLEQCDYETVYSDTWWRKLKTGTGVKGCLLYTSKGEKNKECASNGMMKALKKPQSRRSIGKILRSRN